MTDEARAMALVSLCGLNDRGAVMHVHPVLTRGEEVWRAAHTVMLDARG